MSPEFILSTPLSSLPPPLLAPFSSSLVDLRVEVEEGIIQAY